MLDFLAENYIWFFVAAVVLLFALIGFMVEGKKRKSKKEFKGASVVENAEAIQTAPVENIESVPVENIESSPEMEINDIPVSEGHFETVKPINESSPLETFDENIEVNNIQSEGLGSAPVYDFNLNKNIESFEEIKAQDVPEAVETISFETSPREESVAPQSAPTFNSNIFGEKSNEDPIIPTAPESFYSNPTIPDVQEEVLTFDFNDENKQN